MYCYNDNNNITRIFRRQNMSVLAVTGGVSGLLIAQQQGYGLTGQILCTAGGSLAGSLAKMAIVGDGAGAIALAARRTKAAAKAAMEKAEQR
jgi:hypothetical protein